MDKNKEYPEAIKLTDFNDENFIECIIKLLYLSELLDSTGSFDPNFMCNIVKILETTTDKQFDMWDMSKYYEI